MPEPRLHLDADASSNRLYAALLARGHDVTRTPCPWMAPDATDREQLLGATAQGRSIFTFDIRDFVVLARTYPAHGGIILANQADWKPAGLIEALHRLLAGTGAADWPGQVRWLNDWKE